MALYRHFDVKCSILKAPLNYSDPEWGHLDYHIIKVRHRLPLYPPCTLPMRYTLMPLPTPCLCPPHAPLMLLLCLPLCPPYLCSPYALLSGP